MWWLTGKPRNLQVALRHSSNEQVADRLALVTETLAGFCVANETKGNELDERIAGLVSRIDRLERTLQVVLENSRT